MATMQSQPAANNNESTALVPYEGTDKMSKSLVQVKNSIVPVTKQLIKMNSVYGQFANTVNFNKITNQFLSLNFQISKAEEAAKQTTSSIKTEMANTVKSVQSKIDNLYKGIKSAFSIKNFIGLADEVTVIGTRLNSICGEFEDVEVAQENIMTAANRSRASYQSTADAVIGLGTTAKDAFTDTDEITAFVELLNKQFVISGSSTEGQASAMSQLTQAMSSGTMSGEALNSILKQAPSIVQTIADYMNMPVDKLQELAATGQLSADTVKTALFASASEINSRFNEIPYTFAQLWNIVMNTIIGIFDPVIQLIVEAATWVQENWSQIAPVLVTIAGAVLLVAAAFAIWKGILLVAAAAQAVLNGTLLACPLFWIIIMALTLVLIIYRIIEAINAAQGTTISVLGVIAGALSVLFAFIWNTVTGVLNSIIQFLWTMTVEPFISILEFILNAVNGGFDGIVGAAKNLFGNLIAWFLSFGKIATKVIDAIFGTEWTNELEKLQDEVLSWGKTDNAITLSRDAPEIAAHISYEGAWDFGYDFGANAEDKLTNMFSGSGDLYSFADDMLSGSDSLSSIAEDMFLGSDASIPEIGDNTASIAESTESTASSLDTATEDLSYMRDLAEQEAINRFTTAEIKIDMTGMTNRIDSNMDLDGILNTFTVGFAEALGTAAEGVHI